jgi:hypothetical protein
VRWDTQTKTVWAVFPEQQQTVRLMLNSQVADLFEYDATHPHRTGRPMGSRTLDQPPLLLGGRLVVPVDAVAEAAGPTSSGSTMPSR